MQIWRPTLYLMGLVGMCLISAPDLGAEEPPSTDKGAIVEGAGFTLYDMESIKGSDTDRVERDPVCDRSKRPKIHKVEPDEAKPGQKVTIKGENFGTKECFHGVANMDWHLAEDYNNAKVEQAILHDAERGMQKGLDQFLEEKSFRPGLGGYDRNAG